MTEIVNIDKHRASFGWDLNTVRSDTKVKCYQNAGNGICIYEDINGGKCRISLDDGGLNFDAPSFNEALALLA